jgi:hypothetical protein
MTHRRARRHRIHQLFNRSREFLVLQNRLPAVKFRRIRAEKGDSSLHVEPVSPVLLIEMMAYTHKERAYEFRKSFCTTISRKLLREY